MSLESAETSFFNEKLKDIGQLVRACLDADACRDTRAQTAGIKARIEQLLGTEIGLDDLLNMFEDIIAMPEETLKCMMDELQAQEQDCLEQEQILEFAMIKRVLEVEQPEDLEYQNLLGPSSGQSFSPEDFS